MAANIAMQDPQPIKSIPLYETIGGFLDDQASNMRFDLDDLNPDKFLARRAALHFSRRNPQLLNCKYSLSGCCIQTLNYA